jgi:hypothetical protein
LIAGGQRVPPDCGVLVEANPRTRYTGPDSNVLRAYLEHGGSSSWIPSTIISPTTR